MHIRQYILTRPAQPENLHGAFAREILVSEGLTGFDLVDLDAAGVPDLQPADLVVLTRCFLRDAEMDTLLEAVRRGTTLVCFQPSTRFAAKLGWESQLRVAYPGWVRIRNGRPGAGTPIQTHVPVALYRPKPELADWQPIAVAVRPDWTEAGGPAVVTQPLGKGRAILFFYDLPAAVARIRFGDAELAGYLTTGVWKWPHACDLFIGQVDDRVKHRPQADLHGQLLVHLLTGAAPYPLPRLWYYAEPGQRSVAILQSDDDGSTPEQFREISDCVRARCGTATFYLVFDTKLSAAMVQDLRALGHTFGPHANPHRCQDEWGYDFPRVLAEETAEFKRRFGACSPTIQCHCAPWQGYMDWVPTFQRAGYRLLFAYINGPEPYWQTYQCGSGRPLRFYDRTGRQHDSWQQPVIIYDDASLIPLIRDHPGELIARFEAHLADAVERTHTALPFLSHPVSFATYSRPFMEPCWDRVRKAGVPILNGDQWLEFTDRRAAARIDTEVDDAGTVRYRVEPVAGRLCLMVPGKKTTITSVNGRAPSAVESHRRLEEDYAFVPLAGTGDPVTVELKRN